MQHCGKKTETTTTRRTRVNTTGSKQKRVSVVVPLSGEAKKWNNKKEEKENGGVDKTYRPARLALFLSFFLAALAGLALALLACLILFFSPCVNFFLTTFFFPAWSFLGMMDW